MLHNLGSGEASLALRRSVEEVRRDFPIVEMFWANISQDRLQTSPLSLGREASRPDHHRVDSAHQGDELGSAEGDIVGIDAAGTGLGKFENRIGVEGSWVHITKHQTCSIEGAPTQCQKDLSYHPIYNAISVISQ